MTPEQWEQIKAAFEEAQELPENEREERLRDKYPEEICHAALDLLSHNSPESSCEEPAARRPSFSRDQIIAGRFRIIRFIAAGGMGEVYEARDEWLSVPLALKCVHPEVLSQPGALQRFKRELLVARSVSHENVCRVFDFAEHTCAGTADSPPVSTPCFTMELLDGESLAEFLKRKRPLSIAEAMPLVRQIVAGLSTLHNHGIIHRDLKPSNVMIVPRPNGSPRVVVTDFGLAKVDDSIDADLFQSATEFRGGAPYFMAPELFRGARPSVASDVYSFGLILDEMVTTRRAFGGESVNALLYDKLWQGAIPPGDRAQDLPVEWRETILRSIQPDPVARFESIADAFRSLEPISVSLAERPLQGGRERTGVSRRAVVTSLIGIPVLGGTASVAALALRPISTSVAVFNIENRTSRPEYDYFCKGTTDELARQLLHIPHLKVFPVRSPSPSAKPSFGRFSLDGTLQAHGDEIRLSMRLSDNQQEGALLWSESFDQKGIQNPLALQSTIAQNTVQAVEQRMVLGGNDPNRLTAAAYRMRQWFTLQIARALPEPPTSSVAALDLYMRGHNLLEELSPASATAALEYFKRAIQVDSRFALAYASASDACQMLMNYNYAPHPELARSARDFAFRAVELDPNLAEAHTVLGGVQQIEWDWKSSKNSYLTAIRLKPALARARRWYAGLILQFGDFHRALEEANEAMKLDPYDRSAPPAIGLYEFFAGNYPDAERILVKSLGEKDMLGTRHNLCQLYGWMAYTNYLGNRSAYFEKAFAQVAEIERRERVETGSGATPYADQVSAICWALKGDMQGVMGPIERIEQQVQNSGTSPVMLAWVYAIIGNKDRSCDLLENAAAYHDRRLLYTKIVPFLNNLHGWGRFESLLDQMNLRISI